MKKRLKLRIPITQSEPDAETYRLESLTEFYAAAGEGIAGHARLG